MCLTVNRFHISKARKDIPCYKSLRTIDGIKFTPYIGCPFTEVPLENINKNWGIPFITNIREGYIHVHKENPLYKIDKSVPRYNAYIPKGTKYWKGYFIELGYASKCVKLLEE